MKDRTIFKGEEYKQNKPRGSVVLGWGSRPRLHISDCPEVAGTEVKRSWDLACVG